MKNTEKVKVSVIIPLYNAKEYMEKSILSVREQTYENLEIILVNDGSTDDTALVCENYSKLDKRIRVVNQENAGPGAARNRGLEEATGEFICFVDSDDKLVASAIEIMLHFMEPECDVIQCKSEKIYADGTKDDEPWRDEEMQIGSMEAMKDYLHSEKPIVRFSVWAKLIRRSAIGNLRFLEMNNSEDVVFNAYLIDRCRRIRYIPEVLYLVTVREGSLSRGNLTRKRIESSLKCNEMILQLIKSDKKYSALLGRAYWTSITTMIFNACAVYENKENDWKEDVEFLRENCKRMQIPHDLLNTKQKTFIYLFKMVPRLFVGIVQNILKVRK